MTQLKHSDLHLVDFLMCPLSKDIPQCKPNCNGICQQLMKALVLQVSLYSLGGVVCVGAVAFNKGN